MSIIACCWVDKNYISKMVGKVRKEFGEQKVRLRGSMYM